MSLTWGCQQSGVELSRQKEGKKTKKQKQEGRLALIM
jgi:hypothetical protein